MIHDIFQNPDLRYERKFAIDSVSKEELEILIKYHHCLFREIFYERRVNNIYLDTISLDNYMDNEIGISKRTKVRIRWYGDILGMIQKPVLELKLKDGLLGSKQSYELGDIWISDNLSISDIHSAIISSSIIPDFLKSELLQLNMYLLNSYKRKYYLSSDEKFRITIDSDMVFYKIQNDFNSFLFKREAENTTILELKYDKSHDTNAKYVSNGFPFRNTKYSKYITGMNLLNT